jgi:transposase
MFPQAPPCDPGQPDFPHMSSLLNWIPRYLLTEKKFKRYIVLAKSVKYSAVPGIGPITATALLASLGDGKAFESARQVAAWLGLVPRQDSSGGKPKLPGISKRGDVYLRTFLIHGARAVVKAAAKKDDPKVAGLTPW